jgi:hypothetical protein
VAPVRDTAFLLCRLKCEGCGAGFDRAFWPIDAAGLAGFPEIDGPGPEAAALLARYEALEAGYRQEWEALYAVVSSEPFGTRGIDLAECSVAPRLSRPTAADPGLLAAARAARRCALEPSGWRTSLPSLTCSSPARILKRRTTPFLRHDEFLLATPCAENVSRCLLAFPAAVWYTPAIARQYPRKAETQRSRRGEGAMDASNADSLPRLGVFL